MSLISNDHPAAHTSEPNPPQLQQNNHPQADDPIDPKHLEHISIHNPRRILFLYGSQTGCAQDVAENAAREARRMHFSASVSAMDDYDRVSGPRQQTQTNEKTHRALSLSAISTSS